MVRVFFLYQDFKVRVYVNKGLVFEVLRSKRKILNTFSEPALLAATQQTKSKRSGNDLVIYEPKVRK